jgi:isoquinoline 1-oxidoreductase beta subunit
MNTVETSSGREIVGGTSRGGFLEGIGTTFFLLAFQLPVSPGRAGEPSGVSGQFNASLLSVRTMSSRRSLRKPRVVRGTRPV